MVVAEVATSAIQGSVHRVIPESFCAQKDSGNTLISPVKPVYKACCFHRWFEYCISVLCALL